MIIFDLDGTLANCEHRRHFVDRAHPINENRRLSEISLVSTPHPDPDPYVWKPDWKAFYEACDKDTPIQPVLDAFIHLTQGEPFNHDVQIWSGRCESVREKTLDWLTNLTGYLEDKMYWDRRLKMRPIGDSTPDDQLKEKWLNELILGQYCPLCYGARDITCPCKTTKIQFVFDDRPKVIRMWRRRGIFVFNCCQHDREF